MPIIADTDDEPDETFLLVLTDPDTLEFRDRLAVGTITDDDPGFWIIDRSVWENAAMMTFTVRRDHTSAGDVAVDYPVRGWGLGGGRHSLHRRRRGLRVAVGVGVGHGDNARGGHLGPRSAWRSATTTIPRAPRACWWS